MLTVQLNFCNYSHNVSKSRNTERHLGIPWNDINWGDFYAKSYAEFDSFLDNWTNLVIKEKQMKSNSKNYKYDDERGSGVAG